MAKGEPSAGAVVGIRIWIYHRLDPESSGEKVEMRVTGRLGEDGPLPDEDIKSDEFGD